MKNPNQPFSLKLIYWISSMAVGLVALLLALIIVIKVLLFFDVEIGRTVFSMEVPMELGGATGTLDFDGTTYKIGVHSAKGKIAIENPPKAILAWMNSALIAGLTLALLFTWTFRKFVKNVREGKAFDYGNIKYLKHLSYLACIFWVVIMIGQWMSYRWTVGHLHIDDITFVPDFEIHLNLLLGALFLWVLSHIFMKGLELKQESELTV